MSTEAGTALGSLIGADRAGVVCARKFDEVCGRRAGGGFRACACIVEGGVEAGAHWQWEEWGGRHVAVISSTPYCCYDNFYCCSPTFVSCRLPCPVGPYPPLR